MLHNRPPNRIYLSRIRNELGWNRQQRMNHDIMAMFEFNTVHHEGVISSIDCTSSVDCTLQVYEWINTSSLSNMNFLLWQTELCMFSSSARIVCLRQEADGMDSIS